MRDIETPTRHVFATHLYELFNPGTSTPVKEAENLYCGGSHLNTGRKNCVRISPFPDVQQTISTNNHGR